MNSTIWLSTTAASVVPGNPPGPPPSGSFPGGSPPGGPPPDGSGGGDNTVTITALQRNIAFYGYIFLFLVGYFGHISSIIIFFRRTLRTVSTSCLFVCVTVSNIIYLLVCIYDFLYVGIGLTPINVQTNPAASNALCRFRSFIQSVAMCSSAWLLLAISIDRWLRIRFPFQVKKLCTRKRVLCGALFILICAMAFNSHLLLPTFGSLPGSTICGPISSTTYSFFFRQVWSILLACLQTILPTILLLIVTIDMFIRIRIQQKQRQQLNQNRRNVFVDRQMLIIMLTSIFLFFSTQIPLGLFNILLQPVLQAQLSMTQALQLQSILNFIGSINYATTFYVHCLTSGLFRQEFYNILRYCLRSSNSRRIGIMTATIGQTQLELTRMRTKRNQQECTIENVEK
ncbi:unnamed protein product [Adineta steineri]|uniref:G-protein coupled receptors family 1 profile domain-containing protein n=1 Tax=Adineta steineri TaxID=433720 RepID=A0A816EVX5_9BILA|nr:unnamed protein product [Adineta steineri]CAF1651625.1 unnamed protein product [Adineta steineri]